MYLESPASQATFAKIAKFTRILALWFAVSFANHIHIHIRAKIARFSHEYTGLCSHPAHLWADADYVPPL